jgi:hypothetical protein
MNSEDVLATAPRLISCAMRKGKEYKRNIKGEKQFFLVLKPTLILFFFRLFPYINHFFSNLLFSILIKSLSVYLRPFSVKLNPTWPLL